MKKITKYFGIIFTILIMLPISNVNLLAESENITKTFIVFDENGKNQEITVQIDQTNHNDTNQFGPIKYGFQKNCTDHIGCPYELRGKIDGHDFLVYLQWRVLNTAYYEGFIYE